MINVKMMNTFVAIVAMACVIAYSASTAVVQPVQAKFPDGFMWGTGTASYQIEGAVHVGGRLSTIWDAFSHTPGKTHNGDTGDFADDSYHRWPEDIALMNKIGVQAFRFSFAWGRVVNADGTPNEEGIAHYNQVIDGLLAAGITPFATMFHWDLPLAFSSDDESRGWINSTYIVPLFANYATLLYERFGDRIKHWTTFNEPSSFCLIGYDYGSHAPGRCSDRSRCPFGNSATEPYLCVRSVALSHAYAVQSYRQSFQASQNGTIGITLAAGFAVPISNSSADQDASERSLLFGVGAFADPIWFGDWNDYMKQRAGSLLIPFTAEEQAVLKGSLDFFGLNHYCSSYVWAYNGTAPTPGQGWDTDVFVGSSSYKDGVPIGPQADSPWLYVTPQYFPNIIKWVNQRYTGLPIYITENGVDVPNESLIPMPQALNDTFRIDFLTGYISALEETVESGVDVRGYFLWSLLDNFEWADGYSKRFGIHHVDYADNVARYQKASAIFFSQVIANNSVNTQHDIASYALQLPQFANTNANTNANANANPHGSPHSTPRRPGPAPRHSVATKLAAKYVKE